MVELWVIVCLRKLDYSAVKGLFIIAESEKNETEHVIKEYFADYFLHTSDISMKKSYPKPG